MKKLGCVSFLVMIFFFGVCSSCQSQRKNKEKDNYKEDLSGYRIKYGPEVAEVTDPKTISADKPAAVQNDVTKSLNMKMDSIALRNKKIKLVQGYRILVYTGGSSEEASKAKDKVMQLISKEEVYTIYKQPTFRVKVGDCYTRIEANAIFVKVKEDFPNALIVPDQVNIVKEK